MTSDKGFILPETIGSNPPLSLCITIPDTPEYRAAFWGHMWRLGYWFIWQHGEPGDIRAKEAAAEWREFLSNSHADFLLGEGCTVAGLIDVRQNEEDPCILEKTDDGSTWTPWANLQLCPPLMRIGAAGQPQISVDGGETWEDVELQDPELRDPEGANNRCLAAANAVAALVALHFEVCRTYAPAIPALGFAAAIVSAILALLGLYFAAAALMGYVTALLLYADALTDAAFDEDTQEDLRCILFCNSSETAGAVTFDFEAVKDEAAAKSGVTDIWRVIEIYLDIIAEAGLNRAGATTSVTSADCDDCDACNDNWCREFDLTTWDGGFTTLLGQARGEWVDGVGWTAIPFDVYRLCQIELDFSSFGLVDAITVEWDADIPGGAGGGAGMLLDGVTVHSTSSGAIGGSWASGVTGQTQLFLNFNVSTNGTYVGSARIYKLIVQGHGTTRPPIVTGEISNCYDD